MLDGLKTPNRKLGNCTRCGTQAWVDVDGIPPFIRSCPSCGTMVAFTVPGPPETVEGSP